MISLACLLGGLVSPVTAFVGATIYPVEGPPIPNGVVVVQDSKILEVRAGAPPLGPHVTTIDCRGKVIVPGLVDTHSHIGGWGGGDDSGPIQPDARIVDAINVRDSGFKRALAGGLTTLNIMPGSGHLMSGQTIYVKLRRARTIDEMLIQDPGGWTMGGLKMANGTNPLGDPPSPGTRSKAMALVRAKFIEAREYQAKLEAAKNDPSKAPVRDIGLEAMVEALEGKRIVHHHTHRADDIISVLRLQKEFGFKVVLHHVSEGAMVAREIAEAKAPCSIILVDSPGGKLEAVNLKFETAGILEKAGVNVAFHTDHGITDARLFFRMAALGVRAGMSREGALRALTLAGAEMMGLEGRIGSLRPGKDADLAILSGDPFSVYTKVEQTWVEGKKVFDLSDPKDRLYAVGGYGAGHDQDPYLCCAGGHVGDGK